MLATPRLLAAALAGSAALAEALAAEVPPGWPPEHLDRAALEWALARLHDDPSAAPWSLVFFVRRQGPIVIGGGGFAGPPDRRGAVEIAYSIVAAFEGLGYASEAVRGLAGAAFEDPRVSEVFAETPPAHARSIAVLRRCGFREVDGASEPGLLRFALGARRS